ncbi:MAG: hypothetical protein LPK07_06165 [Hymenobacteraceae bacterium]|nr:hypothetical protein [Hymenobacteraceae bacterium]
MIGLSAIGILLTAFSMVYFGRKYKRLNSPKLKPA